MKLNIIAVERLLQNGRVHEEMVRPQCCYTIVNCHKITVISWSNHRTLGGKILRPCASVTARNINKQPSFRCVPTRTMTKLHLDLANTNFFTHAITTGRDKGVIHSFRAQGWRQNSPTKIRTTHSQKTFRVLSYLWLLFTRYTPELVKKSMNSENWAWFAS